MRAQLMLCAMLFAACEVKIVQPTPPADESTATNASSTDATPTDGDDLPTTPPADTPSPVEEVEEEVDAAEDADESPAASAGRNDETDGDCSPEICDALDNDCDGDTDEGCPPPVSPPLEEGEPEGVSDDEAETDADDGTVEAADETEDPIEPLDDLSVTASWKTDDIVANVPDWTPVRVRTVLDGFTTTDLAAFLVGFVPNPNTADSRDLYLLLETDPADPRWDLMLGAVAGMSGSPIILEGRTAGALSFSIGDDLGPYLFVATPIEKMLDVEAQELDAALADGAPPSGDPLTAVLAMPPGASAWLEGATWADDRYLDVSDDFVGAAAVGGDATPLVPGSAIAVLITSGDVLNLGGIGTVTAVDGDALWAFGHPMTGVGDIAFPFSAASIEAIAASTAWGYSYKVGAPAGPLLGAITSDRTAAIAGRHGLAAPTVAVFTHGTYAGATEHLHHETARLHDAPWFNADQALFAAVWPLTVQRDTPNGAAGSIAYEVQVYVAETDTYASHRDIISSVVWPEAVLFSALFDATVQIIGNDRLPLTLTSVILAADVSDDRREFEIGDLTHAEEIAPGDDLVVAVELLPFGTTEPETRALVLAIPEDFPSGPAELQVGSERSLDGSMPWVTWVDPACGDTDTTETPEDLIAMFNGLPHQQVLVGQLKSRVYPEDNCPSCEDPLALCTPCEPKKDDPCAPPVEPPSVRVASQEDGAILGFRFVTIQVTGAEDAAPPPEDEGPTECPPDGCSETAPEPTEETPSTPEEPEEQPCPEGNEVCDGCDNDADGEADEGCPP